VDTFKEMSSLNMAHHGQISCVISDGGSGGGSGSAVNKANSSAFRHCVITGGMDGTCRVCMHVYIPLYVFVCTHVRTYVQWLSDVYVYKIFIYHVAYLISHLILCI